jgi:hypothetical protein
LEQREGLDEGSPVVSSLAALGVETTIGSCQLRSSDVEVAELAVITDIEPRASDCVHTLAARRMRSSRHALPV